MTMIAAGLRKLVWQRAGNRCEYCRIAQEHESLTLCLDHVIAKKHRGLDEAENLALACFHCNSSKGTDIASIDPADGSLAPLFNPRRDVWVAHFKWEGPVLLGLTPVERVTAHILDINHEERVAIRISLLEEGVSF